VAAQGEDEHKDEEVGDVGDVFEPAIGYAVPKCQILNLGCFSTCLYCYYLRMTLAI